MKLHKFREHPNGIQVCVHFDEARTLSDGSPDPAACLDLMFSHDDPRAPGETDAQYAARSSAYHQMIAREASLLAAEHAAFASPLSEGVALPLEGQPV